jgi:hypothetical protein
MASYTSTVTVTRPSNATPLTGGDVKGIADAGTPANAGSAILEFTKIAPGGAAIMILAAALRIDVAAVPAGMTSYTLHLYKRAPASAFLDNAVWVLAAADRDNYLGSITLGTPAVQGATSPVTLFARTSALNVPFFPPGTSLFGYVVTVAGYTPASGEVMAITLDAVDVF